MALDESAFQRKVARQLLEAGGLLARPAPQLARAQRQKAFCLNQTPSEGEIIRSSTGIKLGGNVLSSAGIGIGAGHRGTPGADAQPAVASVNSTP